MPSNGTLYMTLHNQTAASHLNMEKTCLLPQEILVVSLFSYKMPAGDCHFVVYATFIHFKLFGTVGFLVCYASLKIFSFSQTTG
jgi:hypothetical protein